jgi:predicted HAD superfamily Cof-like phosphohydrolase
MIEQVRQFHNTFQCYTRNAPGIPPKDVIELRLRLIEEEWQELQEAIAKNDLVAIADGICDLHYVLSGTSLAYGIPEDECFREVHCSNMTKANPDGTVTVREDGKVLKPPTFTKPDLLTILQGVCK